LQYAREKQTRNNAAIHNTGAVKMFVAALNSKYCCQAELARKSTCIYKHKTWSRGPTAFQKRGS